MAFEYDPEKDRINRERHGIGLSAFAGFDEDPIVKIDDRRDYGEARFRAFGLIDGEPYCLAFTYRRDDIRLISLRRAHRKELERYET
jgi:uncharacterized DUF497 family protein